MALPSPVPENTYIDCPWVQLGRKCTNPAVVVEKGDQFYFTCTVGHHGCFGAPYAASAHTIPAPAQKVQ